MCFLLFFFSFVFLGSIGVIEDSTGGIFGGVCFHLEQRFRIKITLFEQADFFPGDYT